MIAFTICSNNYLAQASVLAQSIKDHGDFEIILILADKKSDQINYKNLPFDRIVSPEELNISTLQWMKENYNIIEFNTALKPFAFEYLFTNSKADRIYYFDPDIKVYQSLKNFDKFWKDKFILLTPHILTPMPFDGKFPGENLFLNHGIYNLGFLGLGRGELTNTLLLWWSTRLLEKCIIDLKEGYFVDQLWFNLVPLIFNSVSVIESPGCNMAYWNLHERNLTTDVNGIYTINEESPLYFYHFSSFDTTLTYCAPNVPNSRYSFEDRYVLKSLYEDYFSDLSKYNPTFFKSIKYYDSKYPIIIPASNRQKISKKVKSFLAKK